MFPGDHAILVPFQVLAEGRKEGGGSVLIYAIAVGRSFLGNVIQQAYFDDFRELLHPSATGSVVPGFPFHPALRLLHTDLPPPSTGQE